MRCLEFTQQLDTGKTKVWYVKSARSPSDTLAVIKWFPNWRRYALFPMPETVFDVECLTEITEFIRNEMLKRNEGEK
jgi:hypothetical protein